MDGIVHVGRSSEFIVVTVPSMLTDTVPSILCSTIATIESKYRHLLQAYESSNTVAHDVPTYKRHAYEFEAPASPTSVIASCTGSALNLWRGSSSHSWSSASSCSAETDEESLGSEGWDNISITSTTSASARSDDDEHVLLSSAPLQSYGMHYSQSDMRCNAASVRQELRAARPSTPYS